MAWLLALVGCGGSTCLWEDLTVGTSTATVDGAAWDGGVTSANFAGDGLQLVTTGDGALRFTLVMQVDGTGRPMREALDAGEYPVEGVVFDGVDGAFATVFPASGSSYASAEGAPGTFSIEASDDVSVSGCFAFEAGRSDGKVAFTEGAFAASW